MARDAVVSGGGADPLELTARPFAGPEFARSDALSDRSTASTAGDLSRMIRVVAFALLAVASVAVEIAANDRRPFLASAGLASLWIGAAALAGRFIPRPADPFSKPPTWLILPVLGLAASPYVIEPIRRQLTGDGYPTELLMVFSLRAIGLGLAACGGWILCLWVAAVVSLFLTLFAATMTYHSAALVLLGLYTALGGLWLMLVHWNGIRHTFVEPDKSLDVRLDAARTPMPAVFLGVIGALLAVMVGIAALGPARIGRTLGEWFPSSGGTGQNDPFARAGVNDGDMETVGNDPASTGMVDTDQFLESPLPTLYDVFNDLYGEPKKPKAVEKAVSLRPDEVTMAKEKYAADSLRPNREFPASRKTPPRRGDPRSMAARGILEIQGMTPLHLRAVAFDRFDGVSWSEAPIVGNPSMIQRDERAGWMRIASRDPPTEALGAEQRHEVRFVNPAELGTRKGKGTDWIPLPPLALRFRIARVDRIDFYAIGHERVVRFNGRSTPSGLSLSTESRSLDPRNLAPGMFSSQIGGDRFDRLGVPDSLRERLRGLAERMTAGKPRGWPQIEAIVESLRRDYSYDPDADTSARPDDPIGSFLFETRTGPDHLFAGSAVLLLRSLGYPTRLVSGFYARPEAYDPLTQHTPVTRDDLHFWPEVMLSTGDWLVLEPTPGYQPPVFTPTFAARVMAALASLVDGGFRRLPQLFALTIALSLLARFRRELIDLALTAWWRRFPGRDWRETVRRSLSLLERRASWQGRGRPIGQSPPRWLRAELARDPVAEGVELARMAEWAAYAPEHAEPWTRDRAQAVCRGVLDAWTLRRWQQAGGTVARKEPSR
jgi:transglutaminase-like putative cysteine protease